MLRDGAWLRHANHANAMAARMEAAIRDLPGVKLLFPRQANAVFAELPLANGPAWKNRFMLAPLTNTQSHPDGVLSDAEFNWLTLRAKGGFGLTMTCAAHVQAVGQGFPGQLGAFDDKHLPGLTCLASALRANGSVSSLQIHHAGNRSPKELVGTPVCPSDDPKTGARGLTLAEVHDLRDAIDALIAGREVKTPKTNAFGCSIKWAGKAEQVKQFMAKLAKEPVSVEIVDVAAMARALDLPANEAAQPVPWKPSMAPTQVQLVGLLGLLGATPLDIGPRRLVVMLSAWDKAKGERLTPREFLRAKLPLLSQYLDTNPKLWQWTVYGVSAQGGEYDDTQPGAQRKQEAQDLRAADEPSRRIELTDGVSTSHDLTVPLVWLMQ
mgnify:CR=1 FL=1